MNWKTLLIRLGLLIVAVAAGMALLAVSINFMVFLQWLPEAIDGIPAGYAILNKTSYIFMGAIFAGIISIFLAPNWRWVLLLAPLYAPTLFAITYTLMHRAPVVLE